ncbi:MAG: hypothetical protein JW787_02855 [Sedimentisphaerales bacterium]|nr:hypothetical protein [Sedimentisphaerales bacterium]
MIRINDEKTELSDRQLKAIPFIVSSPTYTEGCKKAEVDRKTFYEWLKQPEFKTELDRQRDEITADAFNVLSQSLTKAVDALVGLLDHKDDRLKRLTAKDIIDFIIRHKENEDLDRRLTEVEKRLDNKI